MQTINKTYFGCFPQISELREGDAKICTQDYMCTYSTMTWFWQQLLTEMRKYTRVNWACHNVGWRHCWVPAKSSQLRSEVNCIWDHNLHRQVWSTEEIRIWYKKCYLKLPAPDMQVTVSWILCHAKNTSIFTIARTNFIRFSNSVLQVAFTWCHSRGAISYKAMKSE